jgi:hypothetical protein
MIVGECSNGCEVVHRSNQKLKFKAIVISFD